MTKNKRSKVVLASIMAITVLASALVIPVSATSDLYSVDDVVKTGYNKYLEWKETEGIYGSVLMLADWLEQQSGVVDATQYNTDIVIEFEDGYKVRMLFREDTYGASSIDDSSDYLLSPQSYDGYTISTPTSCKAAVLDVVLHQGFPSGTAPSVQDSLETAGYDVTYRHDTEVSLCWLKTLDEKEFGAVFLRSHGGIDSSDGKLYIMAGDQFPSNPGPGPTGTQVWSMGGIYYYAFSDDFVRTYMSDVPFPNSIYHLLVCYGAAPAAEDDMIDAFLDNGVYVWTGWSKTASVAHGDPAAMLFFQEMSTDATVGEAINAIETAGHSPDPGTTAVLRAVPAAHSDASLGVCPRCVPADTIVASVPGPYPEPWIGADDVNMNGVLDGAESVVSLPDPSWGIGPGIPIEGKFVSIRDDQSVTFGWSSYIGKDGPGDDLLIQECGAMDEGAVVEVSTDGTTWVTLGSIISSSPGNKPWGNVFKFDFSAAGVDNINYVRMTDSLGGASPGFDVLTVQFCNPEISDLVTVESADISGTPKDIFQPGEAVYAIGSGYAATTTYDLYIVDDTTWTDGMAIPARVANTETSVTTDASGNIPAGTLIWTSSVVGIYDIAVDVNGNGQYDTGTDAIDSNIDVGFETIPEFSTIAIPVASILGLLFFFNHRKRRKEQ